MEVNFIKSFVKLEQPTKQKDNDALINNDIPFDKVLTIDEAGTQLGVIDTIEALRIAEERGYDLVCVAPNAPTPVCKMMDYAKYRYDQQKKLKEAKKNQKVVSVKEVRISPTIDKNDFAWKSDAARKFLVDGDKVKVTCRFRGRMIEQAENTKVSFFKFAEGLADIAQIESEPKLDGKNMSMMLGPIPQKKKN
jgi:translation initiation factor IF-3